MSEAEALVYLGVEFLVVLLAIALILRERAREVSNREAARRLRPPRESVLAPWSPPAWYQSITGDDERLPAADAALEEERELRQSRNAA